MPEMQAGVLGGRLLGGRCGRLLLVRPAPSGRRASRNCVRKGPVRCHPPCVPVASFPLSLQAGRVVGGGGGGEVAEAGPTETLDPMPGVPQEEVAGGGVGLGRSGWVGRRREVGPGLSIPRNEDQEPVVHPKGRPDPRGAPALRDRAATERRDWIGWGGMGSCGR